MLVRFRDSAQYFVVATDNEDNIQVDQVTVTTDGTNVGSTNYGTVHATGTTDFVAYTSSISSGTISLTATATDNVTKIKAHRMAVLSTDTSAEAPLSSNQESFTKQISRTTRIRWDALDFGSVWKVNDVQ